MKSEKKKKAETKKPTPVGAELLHVIDSVVKEKGIPRPVLVEALESALLSAARKKLGVHRELEARFNEELGEIELFEFKKVVEEVTDPFTQISLTEGKKLDPEAEIGDDLGVKIDTEIFGRIAAQNAKQVIIQKVRDAERLMIYNEFKDSQGEIITGIVRRFEKGNMIIDLGRAEALLPRSDQVPRENYRVGDRVRALILQVHQEPKGPGPQLILSRRSPDFVKKLFEMEVPEINEGIVRIMAVARDPGVRSKIAVLSVDSDVDPVGACVGMKGSRVQAVVQELRGEKIDIIPWTNDIAKNVCNALAPAEVSRMIIDDEQKLVLVIVADDQLSVAIGRKGQNVRLASQLTGWEIDIKSESEMEKLTRQAQSTLGKIPGIGPVLAEKLYLEGYTSAYELSRADEEVLAGIPGIGRTKARKIIDAAGAYFQEQLAVGEVDARGRPRKKPKPESPEERQNLPGEETSSPPSTGEASSDSLASHSHSSASPTMTETPASAGREESLPSSVQNPTADGPEET